MSNRNQGKRMSPEQKQQREDEFIAGVEQVIGGTVLPWQRELLLFIRSTSLAGKPVDMQLIRDSVRNRDALTRGLKSKS